MICGKQYDDT